MPTRDLTLALHERRDGNALLAAARDLDKLGRGVDATGEKFTAMAQDAKALTVEMEKANARVIELRRQFAATGDRALLVDIRRERAHLGQLRRLIEEMFPDVAEKVGGGFAISIGKAFSSMPLRTKAITALVGLAVIAAPAIGAIVSGAVVGLTATGGIAGGIIAATKDPRVRSAAQDFGKSISKEFFGSGEAFVQPTIRALEILKKDFAALDLKSAFAPGAAAVETLAHGIGNFAKEIMPGFNRVMERAPLLAEIMADGLGNVGDAISDMLIVMMESEGTIEGLRAAFTLLAGVIRGFGNVAAFLGDSFHVVNVIVAKTSGAVEDLYQLFADQTQQIPILGNLFGFFAEQFAKVNDRAEEFTGTGEDVISVLERANPLQGAINRALAAGIPFVAQSGLTWEEYENRVRDANRALDEMIDTQFGVDNANLAVNRGLLDLKESIKENGRHWETNTDAGLANRDALLSQVEALDRQRRANIKAGKDADIAGAAFNRELGKLETLARNADISEAELRDLVGDYRVNITTTTTLITRRLNYTSNYLQPGDIQGRQHGGPVMAGATYAINEHLHRGRPVETVTFPKTGTVNPAGLTPMGGGNTYNITINVPPGANLAEVGRVNVEAIQAYERRNTAAWRS